MIEKPGFATLYLWEKQQPFDIGDLLFLLGGQQPPTNVELAIHHFGNAMYCTNDLKIYPVSKDEDTKNKDVHESLKPWHPTFRTALLEDRLSQYGLGLPDYEISFCPREPLSAKGVDAQKIGAVAAHLTVYGGLDLLAVPGTSIEKDQLLASKSIAQKLGIPVVPE